MKQKIILLILFILLCASPVFAQYEYNFPQFFDETWDFIKQPVKWDGNDYFKMGIIGAGTAGFMLFVDQPIRNNVLEDQGEYYHSAVLEGGRMYGELYSPVIFFSGFALYSLITDDTWARKVAYEIGQASLYAGGINYLLKVVIGRARPFLNKGNGTYHPFNLSDDYHSMPSGHTTAAFVISTVLARNVDPIWLKALFYIPPALTYVSRVYQDWHWTSDAFVGAAFGFYIATWVVDKHEKTVNSDKKENQGFLDRLQIQPVVSGDFYGVNMSLPLF
jgi:membrane-associated phospholipid phosphatase